MCNTLDAFGGGIERNLIKSATRLTTGVNIPIEHRDAEKSAETNARIAITQSVAKQISEQAGIFEEYVKIAVTKSFEKIVQEQLNLDMIVEEATNRLQDVQPNETDTNSQIGDISDDWLNHFREVACKKSSEDAQDLFSKMLEGEIRKPGSFSLRALTTLADMDQKVATLFNALCSLCIVSLADSDDFLKSRPNFKISDARIPIIRDTPTDVAATPAYPARRSSEFAQISGAIYQTYGFGINEFQLLSEYGLVLDSTLIEYSHFWYNNEMWGILKPNSTGGDFQKIKISGYCLSAVGKELFHITERDNPRGYFERLIDFLKEYYDVKMHRFPKPQPSAQ